MKKSKRSIFVIVIFSAGVPLSLALLLLILVAARAHENIIEGEIEIATGLSAKVSGFETIDTNTCSIDNISIGGSLIRAKDLIIGLNMRPFHVNTVEIGGLEADITGENLDRLSRMLNRIRSSQSEGSKVGPLKVLVHSGAFNIPFKFSQKYNRNYMISPEFPIIIKYSSIGNLSVTAGKLQLRVAEKQYKASVSIDYNSNNQTGKISFLGDLAFFDHFTMPVCSFKDTRVEAGINFTGDPNKKFFAGFSIAEENKMGSFRGRFTLDTEHRIFKIDGLEGSLTRFFELINHYLSRYLSVNGDYFLYGGKVFYSDPDNVKNTFFLRLENPSLNFIKDIKIKGGVMHMTDLPGLNTGLLLVQGDVSYQPKKNGYNLVSEGFTGYSEKEEIFWEADGVMNFKGISVSSDINFSLYQIPVNAAEFIFTIYDADSSWIQKLKGPVDIFCRGFDISKPDKEPIIFSSGSSGLDFWIKDKIPAIEGIFFNSLKMYLPPLESDEDTDKEEKLELGIE